MGDESDDVKSSLWVSRKYRQYLSWSDFPRTQSLRQSLRANVLLGGTTPALRELEGRQTGRDWQEVPWVTALMNDELLHWPLLYKVPWITVVGSSAGDHSVIKKLFGRLVGNVVPGTSHQREKGRENVPTICLCFLSSAGQNLLPGELTLPRMQAVSPLQEPPGKQICACGLMASWGGNSSDSVGDHWDGLGGVSWETGRKVRLKKSE